MLSIAGVTKLVNGVPLYERASFQINPGEKVGLVGANGSGKTTFFSMIVGEQTPDEGQVSIKNGTRVAYFSQKIGEMSGRTALAEVMAGNQEVQLLAEQLTLFEEKLSDPNLDPDEMNVILEKMGDVQTEFDKRGGYTLESTAQEVLTGLGIAPSDHDKAVELFSGGWKMRIALAKVLIQLPDLILMDEPTNYLDMETILWLEQWLSDFKGALLMTSHDRVFMNKVVKKIVEVSRQGVFTYSGNYDFYLQEKAIRRRNNQAEFARQQANLKKEQQFIDKFKARASHAAQVQSRIKKLDKIERVELEQEGEKMSIMLPEIDRGGNDVVVINNLGMAFGEHQVLSNLNCTISRQDKVAVVGVNGAGKSTLLKLITGELTPTTGEIKLGPSISAGYFGQYSFESLDDNLTILEQVQQMLPAATDGFIRNLLAALLFRGDDVFKKIKVLSGGEKSRVILSWLLTNPYNLLILDEPTNHLDIDSREVLLDALKRYQGTILFVSHDRFFLQELASKVMEVSQGEVYLHPGDYKSYLENNVNNSR